VPRSNPTLLVAALAISCSGPASTSDRPRARDDASTAVAELQASKFTAARLTASDLLAADPTSSRAAAVRAIAMYQMAGGELIATLSQILEQGEMLKAFDHAGGRKAWETFLGRLDTIDRDLAVVAADPGFSLELCLACWEYDWNGNGTIDDGDRRLFELVFDGQGGEIPPGDPRRRPTFRFDVGDAEWARAMISFQRAVGELVLAYRWSELDKLLGFGFGAPSGKLVIRLADRGRVQRAHASILAGLDHADRCRAAYLAETDDDREWVPNPRQKNHPIPLAVDDELYALWAAITGDLRRLLRSEEGISLRELVRFVEEDDSLRSLVPDAYIDLGRMLREPRDIEIDVGIFGRGQDPDEAELISLLRGILGNGYQPAMRATPLVGRLRHMKQQLDRGQDTFERKLRYLLWLN
jgi:hypothetical protein